MVGPVNYDSDMVRYVWDGRAQRFGYNPYAVVPSDPSLAHTHTADTVRMPSRHDRTPYPPAAQLFFRLMVTVWESARVMKSVLTLLDMITIFLVWRWLRATGRPEWLVIGYAWNPLVILEVAHSGHIDALGAFWIAASRLCDGAPAPRSRGRGLHARRGDQAPADRARAALHRPGATRGTPRLAPPRWRSSTCRS